MKRALLVYNPTSGKKSIHRKIGHIHKRFQEKNILLQPFCILKNSQAELKKLLKEDKPDSIIISGGDGTVHSVINILLKEKIRIPVGIIPAGTCNDFAHSINIPRRVKKCQDIILSGKTKKIDIGIINGKTAFLSTCAGGLFTKASLNTPRRLITGLGHIAYYLHALKEIKTLKPLKIVLEIEGRRYEKDVLLFLILNGRQGAGFRNLMKEADLTDGLLSMIIVKKCKHIDLVRIFSKTVSRKSLTDKNVEIIRSSRFKVKSDNNIKIIIDGEMETCTPIDVKVRTNALEVFVK